MGLLVRRLRAENTLPLRYAMVLGLLEREGPLTTSELAQRERVRPQSMAETVKRLEAQRLVARERDPTDGRRILVAVTATGHETILGNRVRREQWLAGAIARELTTRERETLAAAAPLLLRLANLES